jgi:hypothetical protein
MAYLALSGVNIKKHTSEYLCTYSRQSNKLAGCNKRAGSI